MDLYIIYYIAFISLSVLPYPSLSQRAQDDEDFAINSSNRNGASDSSGFEYPNKPNVYPTNTPFQETTVDARILVDVGVQYDYRYFMLPYVSVTPELTAFHELITQNIRQELDSIEERCQYKVLRARPGALLNGRPTVFVLIQITQPKRAIIHPMIPIHLTNCAKRNKLGNLTMAEQIIFPYNICRTSEVYCLPSCNIGSYCDNKIDCQRTALDEPNSCPKCLYKQVSLRVSNVIINQGSPLKMYCVYNQSCVEKQFSTRPIIKWHLPKTLKSWESKLLNVQDPWSIIPHDQVESGLYSCSIDGERGQASIRVFKKPVVSVSEMTPGLDTIILSETYGSSIKLWCNSTHGGHVSWFRTKDNMDINSMDPNLKAPATQIDDQHSLLTIDRLSTSMQLHYQCLIRWGIRNQQLIRKTVKILIQCDSTTQFACNSRKSGSHECIPKSQVCDTVSQCSNGADESNCKFCRSKAVIIEPPSRRFKIEIDKFFSIICKTTSPECGDLKWFKNSRPLQFENNIILIKGHLMITKTALNHSGIYSCHGTKEIIQSSSSLGQRTGDVSRMKPNEIELTVVKELKPVLQLNANNSVFKVPYNEALIVRCNVDNKETSHYTEYTPNWVYHGSKQTKSGFTPPGVTITSEYGHLTSNLIINRVTPANVGKYTCKVKWKQGTIEKTIEVKLFQCNVVERKCVKTSQCVAKFQWCDGIPDCSDNSDEANCRACLGTSESDAGFIIAKPSYIRIPLYKSGFVTCYRSPQCADIYWQYINGNTRDKSTILQNTASIRLSRPIHENSYMKSGLEFLNATLNMTGKYKCAFGRKNSEFSVVVDPGKTKIRYNQPFVSLQFGERFTIDCESDNYPPQWKVEEKQIHLNTRQIDSRTTRLIIDSASQDLIATYICFTSYPDRKIAKMTQSNIYIFVQPQKQCNRNTHFLCSDKKKCIPKTKICNSIADCLDRSDEFRCKCSGELVITQKVFQPGTVFQFICHKPQPDCDEVKWMHQDMSLFGKTFFAQKENLIVVSPKKYINTTILCYSGNKVASARFDIN